MNNFLNLVKINTLTFFDFYKIKNTQDKKEKQKALGKFLLIIFVFIYLAGVLYYYANELFKGLLLINAPEILFALFMCFSSIFIFMTNLFKVNGLLYGTKDYEMLISMPINKKTIILSKLFELYIYNLIYTLLFMIPAFIVYASNISLTLLFILLFFLTLLIIPIVPLIISSFVGLFINIISIKFKHKNIVNTILMLLFTIVAIYYSSQLKMTSSIDMANISKTIINYFNNFYPLTNVYMNIINICSLKDFFLFVLVSGVLLLLFIFILNKFYEIINNKLKESNLTSFVYKKSKKTNVLKALYHKEIKRYFSSPNYVLNTAMGSILLTLVTIIYAFMGGDKVEALLQTPGLIDMINNLCPLIITLFCLMNCSTYASISLEGKNLWIIKTIPVSALEIFKAKILVNLTILIPTIIINSTILIFIIKGSFIIYLFMILIALLASFFISLLGLYINIKNPVFDWKNEITVIKQGMSSFLTIFSGLILGIIIILIGNNISFNIIYYYLIIMIVFTITDYLLITYFNKNGEKLLLNL